MLHSWHTWEGRFKSQALLDETAIISCMAYVDLNPIRANVSEDLPSSDFTSVQQRLQQITKKKKDRKQPRLMSMREKQRQNQPYQAVPYNLKDYLDLVDWTGRHIHPTKRGHIARQKPRLLAALGLTDKQWHILALEIQKKSILMLNGLETIEVLEKRAAKAA